LGVIKVNFYATRHLLIIYSAFVKYSRKNENRVKQFISYLYTSTDLMIQLGVRSCIIFSMSLVSP